MITHEELTKIAQDVEENGFSDDSKADLEKTAQALFLLDHLTKDIEKTADFSSKLTSGLGQTAMVGLGVAFAGKMAEKIEKTLDKRDFRKRENGLIAFARHENPSLKDVSNGKMKMWLRSAYSVSPNVAKDPMLASTFINTAHAVGGVDLNTAKTVADINSRGGKDYSKIYDAVRGSSSGLPTEVVSY